LKKYVEFNNRYVAEYYDLAGTDLS